MNKQGRVTELIQQNTQRVHPTRPFERTEIDRTKLDLVIVDENAKQPISRPWLTLEICPFTHLLVRFHLSKHQGEEV